MHRFVKIATISDIPQNGMRAFEYNGRRIAIFNAAGNYYATDDTCSHDDASLTEGWYEPEDETVECPMHGSRFNIKTGQALTLPAFEPIAVYSVRIEGDDVFVELSEE